MNRKKTAAGEPPPKGSSTGTYMFDRKLGKVVKVSDRPPRVSAKSARGGRASAGGSPCGRPVCAGGRCAGGGGLGPD